MTGSFSYASFSRQNDRDGGWGFGEFTGTATFEQAVGLRAWIPSAITGGPDPGNYPSKEEIAQLTRRFAWLPMNQSGPAQGQGFAFYASAQAGQDSTGRPGNVFTYVQLCPDGTMGLFHPTRLLYSPDIPVPFGKRQVDEVKIPESIIRPGPITDEIIDAFVYASDPPEGIAATETAPLGTPFPEVYPAERILMARAISAVISKGNRPVVIACPLGEAALWVATIARELGYPTDFSFSTFETLESIQNIVQTGCNVTIVGDYDADDVAAKLRSTRAVVVDPTKPLAPMVRQYLDNPNAGPTTAAFPAVSHAEANPPADNTPIAPVTPVAEMTSAATTTPVAPVGSVADLAPLTPAAPTPESLPAMFAAGDVFEMASNPFEEEPPVVTPMIPEPTHHITERPLPIDQRFTEFETRLNAHIAPPTPRERKFIQGFQVFEIYFAMDQEPTEETLRKLNRYYELLLLDPSDELGCRVRGSFVAMILLHGVPRYWFGETSFVALTFTQKEPVVHQAAQCVIEWLSQKRPDTTPAEFLTSFRQQATRNASLTALQNVVYKRARQYALETRPPRQAEIKQPPEPPPEPPAQFPTNNSPLTSFQPTPPSLDVEADLAHPEKLRQEQQVVAGQVSTAIWQFTDQQRQS